MNREVNSLQSTRVLIISDRLIDCAKVLSNYLCSVGIYVVDVVENKQQVLKTAEEQTIDYLIIAGYLKDISNYEVIEELRNQHKSFIPIHWAMLDSLITSYCFQYQIPLKFDRTLPMTDFAAYLQEHKDDQWTYREELNEETTFEDNLNIQRRNQSIFKQFINIVLGRPA